MQRQTGLQLSSPAVCLFFFFFYFVLAFVFDNVCQDMYAVSVHSMLQKSEGNLTVPVIVWLSVGLGRAGERRWCWNQSQHKLGHRQILDWSLLLPDHHLLLVAFLSLERNCRDVNNIWGFLIMVHLTLFVWNIFPNQSDPKTPQIIEAQEKVHLMVFYDLKGK